LVFDVVGEGFDLGAHFDTVDDSVT
jgi:hypothetical protein